MKCSFVIPTKNCAPWLPHAVFSIQKQTHKDIEIIIVDDHSTDSTDDYLNWLIKDDERVKTIYLPIERGGRSFARNEGNDFASGEIIFVLDADDIASPDRVKKTLDKIEKGAEFVYGGCEIMDFSGKKIGVQMADVFNFQKAVETKLNYIVHSTVAYTKNMAKRFPYSEDQEIMDNGLDDWEQQLRIAESGAKMDFIPGSIGAYRILESSISSRRDADVVERVKNKYLEKLMVKA